MGKAVAPDQVIPVAGLLYTDPGILPEAEEAICDILGPAGGSTDEIVFDFSSYYEKEMGAPLFRSWRLFERPCDPGSLASLKRETNRVETLFMGDKGRKINIDPGFLSPLNLVLATTKYAAHRIYIGMGIYAQLELIFERGAFRPLPWTYPDYRTPQLAALLATARKKSLRALSRPLPGPRGEKKVGSK